MSVAGWTNDELARIGEANELEVSPLRADGRLGRPVPIWVVRVGDELYVRSWRGEGGAWYRAATARRRGEVNSGGVRRTVEFVDANDSVNAAADAAYREKYARYPSYVEPMVTDQARATTLQLVPREDGA